MRQRLRLVLALAVAVVALWAAFAGVSAADLLDAFKSASVFWILVALASVFLTLSLVVLRWRMLLGVTAGEVSWSVLWHAVVLGQVANLVAPLRLGDGVRVVATSLGLGRSVATVSAAAAVERALDVAALGVAAAVVTAADVVPAWGRPALVAVAGVGAAAAVLVAVATRSRLIGKPSALADGTRHAGVGGAVLRQLSLVRDGLVRLDHGSALAISAALSLAVMLASTLTILLVLQAFDFDVPPVAALVLLVILQAGSAIVAVPGALGVSQLLTVKTLDLWHVPSADALGFAIALYVVARAPKVALVPRSLAVLALLRRRGYACRRASSAHDEPAAAPASERRR